ncbi:GTP-binding domain HSR1-related protein [Macrophomina phaseolina MS6]|uniref:Nucleolar GTP-binding protein 2 n=2 Tax=Macrophomina phaseolina TaxID=35725 RepID=K2RKY2_MACPH|nr:GTP-binding domain HSR1-related protein [Macrophomina phaseolina MS6]KAH7048319.1 NUC091 domain-containing protein [Macrophomina phaseolina]
MGTGKKEANRKERQGKTGDGMGNVKTKGENFYRSAKKVKLLNMYKDGKPQRNARGDITKAASYQSKEVPTARIEPNRKWFTNSRVISQESLSAFRTAMAERASDPYSVLLKSNKLPMSLIRDGQDKVNGIKQHQAKMAIETAPFSDTFGPKAQRKRVKIGVSSIEDLAGETVKNHDEYLDRLEQAHLLSGNAGASAEGGDDFDAGTTSAAREAVFSKGQSKRIWNELYKVIDSSDVVIHVLDARDPLGTRCRSVEKYIKEEAPHKHLVFVLNKCDLVPTKVAAAWVRYLSKDYPTLAFHASINNSFGKGSLISLLRQFSSLHSDRKQISCGLIGYPNTGKSSIINTLRKKKVCTTAPIPGETKVWQYVTLMKRIYLIDCPGIVPPNGNDTDADLLLRGVVRIEKTEHPEQYVAAALGKCKKQHVTRTYEIKDYTDHTDLLEQLARKGGRLLKGGEPDLDGVAKMMLTDFLRGKIPWYTPLPDKEEDQAANPEGREGRLGEMPRKRKREEEAQSEAGGEVQEPEDDEEDDSDFEGFDEDGDSEDDSEGGDAETLVDDEDDDDEDDEAVEAELAQISKALASAKKKRKT